MSWDKEFIVWRVGTDGGGEVVHQVAKLKDARYWLNYIAESGDAIFRTSKHVKYSGDGTPEYVSHLIARQNVGYDEDAWKALISESGKEIIYPSESS